MISWNSIDNCTMYNQNIVHIDKECQPLFSGQCMQVSLLQLRNHQQEVRPVLRGRHTLVVNKLAVRGYVLGK